MSKASSPKHTSLGPENSYVIKNGESSFLGVPSPELWVSGADKLWGTRRLSELLPQHTLHGSRLLCLAQKEEEEGR